MRNIRVQQDIVASMLFHFHVFRVLTFPFRDAFLSRTCSSFEDVLFVSSWAVKRQQRLWHCLLHRSNCLSVCVITAKVALGKQPWKNQLAKYLLANSERMDLAKMRDLPPKNKTPEPKSSVRLLLKTAALTRTGPEHKYFEFRSDILTS